MIKYIYFLVTLFLLVSYPFMGNAQTKIQSSTLSTAGRLLSSTSFSANTIVGQSSPVENLTSGNYSLASGFSNTVNNIFRSISLISPNGSEMLLAGSTKSIEWNANIVSDIKLEYSVNNGIDWITIVESINASSDNYTWTLPNVESDLCLLRVLDVSNNAIADQSDGTFKIINYPTSISVTLSLSFEDFTNTKSFRMVGFPGNVNIAMKEIVSGEYGTDWKAAYDNGAASNYLIEFDGSEIFNFRPGIGFWLHSKTNISFNQNNSTVDIDDDFQYAILLHQGWNIISNPFDQNISWSNIKVINNISEDLHYFNGTYSSSSQLEPYKGYYFYNVTNLDNLIIPFVSSSNDNSETILNKTNPTTKNLDLILSENNISKAKVTIGYNQSSHITYDVLDKFSPPGDFEDLSIKLYNENLESGYKYLSRDIRSKIENGQVYDLKIKISPGKEIYLNTIGAENFESNEIYLVDKRLNRFYNLKNQNSIELKSLHNQNLYQVLIGDDTFVENYKSILLPKNFNLSQNYPNPFNPNTIISYTMPREGKVNIKLYNLLGEEVYTIFDGYKNIGTYELLVDAKSLTSGIYFYTLRTKDFVETKKMILLK